MHHDLPAAARGGGGFWNPRLAGEKTTGTLFKSVPENSTKLSSCADNMANRRIPDEKAQSGLRTQFCSTQTKGRYRDAAILSQPR